MNVTGWIFMVTSVGFVLGLAGWCYYHLLFAPGDEERSQGQGQGQGEVDGDGVDGTDRNRT